MKTHSLVFSEFWQSLYSWCYSETRVKQHIVCYFHIYYTPTVMVHNQIIVRVEQISYLLKKCSVWLLY